MDYKQAGVDVEAGYKAVELMGKHVKNTFRPEVVSDIGGFGGLFSLANKKMEEPILVSGTDGVGTKLKLAFLMNKHNTIGIDCVAMCVNDIVCSGAEPLFFLDYIACGKNVPERIAEIVEGVSKGCIFAGAALIGGETAEMPGFYPEDEYDLAGFAVGIVDKKDLIDKELMQEGDVLIGLPSTGIHSNGYSLVRKIFNPNPSSLNEYIEQLGCTLGEELLKPTKIYVKQILELKKHIRIKGISNITGGGFIENIPRMFPNGLCPVIKKGTWDILPIFELIEKMGNVERMSMYNTYNMGIGMVLAVSPEDVNKTLTILEQMNEKGYIIGEVKKGDKICLE